MYKLNGAYTHTNSGGTMVTCPLCLGEGKIKKLDEAIKDLEDEKKEGSKRGRSKKESGKANNLQSENG